MLTTCSMYSVYVGHAVAAMLAARGKIGTLPIRSGVAAGVGGSLAGAGGILCLAGMNRFSGPEQISGIEVGELATRGIYRYSRNPQYAGYVAVLTGLGIASRSAVALGLAGAAAAIFRWWVPVEERHLERMFGRAYRQYRAEIPRWFGIGRPRQ